MPAVRKVWTPPLSGKLIAVDCETTGAKVSRGHRPFLYTACNDSGGSTALWDDHQPDPVTGRHLLLPVADGLQPCASDALDGPVRRTMRTWMADPTVTKVFHNSKFDLRMMLRHGITVLGRFEDTMVMAHVLNAYGEIGRETDDKKDVKVLKLLALDILAKKYLGDQKVDEVKLWLVEHSREFAKTHNRAPNYSDVPREIMEKYARHDTVLTMRLFYMMNEHLDRLKLRELYETEMKLLRAVIEMEERGVRLDLEFMNKRIDELAKLRDDSLVALRTTAKPIKAIRTKTRTKDKVKYKVRQVYTIPVETINFGSDNQMRKLLTQYGLRTEELTKGGNMKMDERNLSRIVHPFPKELVRWRQYMKLRKTYYVGYRDRANGDILHPNYIQIGAATGRFSSQDPNCQNIPTEKVVRERAGADVIYKGVKRCFIPRDGFVNYHADYSQIEMKCMAHFAKDPKIDQAVQERDIHTEITKLLYGDLTDPKEFEYKRVLAKIVSFGILYGMSRKTFMWKLKVDVAKVDEILSHYFNTFPGIKRFQAETMREVRETGQVRNMFGRRYLIFRDKGYKAVNYLCQGSAADLLKRAMVKLYEFFKANGLKSAMLMQIHDEVVFEVHESEDKWLPREIVRIMTDVPECRVPIKASMERADGNWEELHKVCMKCGESIYPDQEHICPLQGRWPKEYSRLIPPRRSLVLPSGTGPAPSSGATC